MSHSPADPSAPRPRRVLVTGASGYIGSRLIPALLQEGYDVRAAFSSPDKATGYWWHDQVEVVEMDVLDAAQVRAAMGDMDALFYLIHGMGGDDFVEKDRESAEHTRDAIDAAGVSRVVYLSGVVPDVPEEEHSDHISSRLEVERVLGESQASVITLCAALIIGAGSTSFEIVRQVSERMPLQTVPTWMDSTVQPIAVTDVVTALVAALTAPGETRHVDVGGAEAMPYPELLQLYAEVADLERPQVDVPLLPTQAVGTIAGWLTDVPSPTVSSLVESLHHDMVVTDDRPMRELMPEGHHPVGVRESFERALAQPDESLAFADRDPLGPMPHDPTWSGGGHSGPAKAAAAGISAVASAAARVVEKFGNDEKGDGSGSAR